MSDLLRKMCAAYDNVITTPGGFDSSEKRRRAMRAALAVLADNVTDEMVRSASAAHEKADFYAGERGWMKAAVSAAIREAGK